MTVQTASSALPTDSTAVIARARALRHDLAAGGAAIDASGSDPTDNMRRLGEAGLHALNVPVEYGGLWRGSAFAGWRAVVETTIEVSAGDGSTGQCWSTTGMVARELFGAADLPGGTKQQMARELLFEGRRLVASNAETGASGVVGRRVPGGIVVSGTKSFNTNSGGGGRDVACVGFPLLGPDGTRESATRHHALVRLDDPAVEPAHDWDNMGQRGTYSQTITYHDVFVPDAWHFASHQGDPHFLAAVMLAHAALLQGIGEGALEAALTFVRGLDRPSAPMFGSASADPLMHRQIGEMSSQLAAARALLTSTADLLEGDADPRTSAIAGVRAKIASTRAGLDVTARIHDLTGARSTARKYGLDRFWRNARTFGSHDSLDVKNALVGAFELTGHYPVLADYVKYQ
jgi:alkylation response protein AidB-like acyl-CoA dehydrogenase